MLVNSYLVSSLLKEMKKIEETYGVKSKFFDECWFCIKGERSDVRRAEDFINDMMKSLIF